MYQLLSNSNDVRLCANFSYFTMALKVIESDFFGENLQLQSMDYKVNQSNKQKEWINENNFNFSKNIFLSLDSTCSLFNKLFHIHNQNKQSIYCVI